MEKISLNDIEDCFTPESKKIYLTKINPNKFINPFTTLQRIAPHLDNVIPIARVLISKFTEGVSLGVYGFGTYLDIRYGKRVDGTYLVMMYVTLSSYVIENAQFAREAEINGFIQK